MTTVTIDGFEYQLNSNNNSFTATVVKSNTKLSGRVEIPSIIKHDGHDYIVTNIEEYRLYDNDFETLVLPTQLVSLQPPHCFGNIVNNNILLKSFEISEDAPHYKTIDGVLYVRQEDAPQKLWLDCIPDGKEGSLTLGRDVVGVISPSNHGGWSISKLVLSTPQFITKLDFLHLTKLQSIKWEEDNNEYSKIGDLIVKNNTIAIFYPRDITGLYELPECIEKIGRACFACTKLSEIKLSNHLKHIDSFAFWYANISQINLPDSIIQISSYAFTGCSNLISVKLPTHLKEIKDGTFSGCRKLSNLEVPGSVVKIGDIVGYRDIKVKVTIHNAQGNVNIEKQKGQIEWIYTETKEQQNQQWCSEVIRATKSGRISDEDKNALYRLGEHMRKQKSDMEFDIDQAIYQIKKAKRRKIVLVILVAIILSIILLLIVL